MENGDSRGPTAGVGTRGGVKGCGGFLSEKRKSHENEDGGGGGHETECEGGMEKRLEMRGQDHFLAGT